MAKRRHSSLTLAPGCSANMTKSRRRTTMDTSFQAMPSSMHQVGHRLYQMCPPCLRTPVHYVSGPYTPAWERGLGVRGEGVMTRQESTGQDKTNMPSLTSRARGLRHSDTLAEKLAWGL